MIVGNKKENKDTEKISHYLIEKGEFEMIREATQEKKMEDLERPVGRIEYLGANGKVGESVEYSNSEQFRRDIESETYYGTPLSVVLYRDSHGGTISKDFLYELDPPPKRIRMEDTPARKQSFDEMFQAIEKERGSKPAVPLARTEHQWEH